MDSSSRMAAGSYAPYGPPCGRTVTVLRADALMAGAVHAPEAFDSLAQLGAVQALEASYRARQNGVNFWSAR